MTFITNSEMSKYNECKLAHYYKYVKQVDSKAKSEALEIGSDYHTLLENYYTTNNPDTLTRKADDDRLPSYMADNYKQWLEETNPDEHWEIIGIEETIEAVIGGHTFKGQYDLKILDTKNGRKYYVDHKTYGRQDITTYSNMLQQFRLYHLIDSYQNPDDPVAGTWLNMAKKIKGVRQYTPPLFKRSLITNDTSLYEQDEKMFTNIADQINNQNSTPPDRTLSTNCQYCEYKQPCHMQNQGHDIEPILYFAYNKHDPNSRYNEQNNNDPLKGETT